MINDTLGTSIDPEYIECLFDLRPRNGGRLLGFYEASGWEPKFGFEKDIELVCEHISMSNERSKTRVLSTSQYIIDLHGDEYEDVPITYIHQREQLGLDRAVV